MRSVVRRMVSVVVAVVVGLVWGVEDLDEDGWRVGGSEVSDEEICGSGSSKGLGRRRDRSAGRRWTKSTRSSSLLCN